MSHLHLRALKPSKNGKRNTEAERYTYITRGLLVTPGAPYYYIMFVHIHTFFSQAVKHHENVKFKECVREST